MIGVIGFLAGVSVTGIVWYVKDYCMDCLYLKGYSRGYEKGYKEATEDSLKVYENVWEKMKEDSEQ